MGHTGQEPRAKDNMRSARNQLAAALRPLPQPPLHLRDKLLAGGESGLLVARWGLVVALCGDHPVKSSICHPSYFATSCSQEGSLWFGVALGGDHPVKPSVCHPSYFGTQGPSQEGNLWFGVALGGDHPV